ncbi:hypothetical protein [Persicobacter psychrovividus]
MRLKLHIVLFFLVAWAAPTLSNAQELDDDLYLSQFVWGVNKASNSGLIGGFMFRYSKMKNEKTYQSYGLEIVNIKHAKERRESTLTGSSYIFGKSNYLYNFRFQYGLERRLFRKAAQQGVQINFLTSIGPSIGLVTPYYIEVAGDDASGNRQQYDPNNPAHQRGSILGPGGIFQGVPESSFAFGGNLKAAMTFEFGGSKKNIAGIEVGALIDVFAQKVIIMPNAENSAFYPNVYITFYYGSQR